MPWAKPRTYTCREPGCGKQFQSTTTNVLRCPEHRQAQHKARVLARYHAQRGPRKGQGHAKGKMDDIKRLNLLIDRSAQYARCPCCRRKMRNCICYAHDCLEARPPEVATWQPWKG